MARKTAALAVSQEEHTQAEERYKLALSGIDETIQSVRENRAKVKRIFALQEMAEFEK
jgi:hypothetical protein